MSLPDKLSIVVGVAMLPLLVGAGLSVHLGLGLLAAAGWCGGAFWILQADDGAADVEEQEIFVELQGDPAGTLRPVERFEAGEA